MIATDHDLIRQAAENFGAEVVMTRTDHPSGTDRLAEVADQLGLDDQQIIVNLQGDEPDVSPKLLDQVAELLTQADEATMATLCEPLTRYEDYQTQTSSRSCAQPPVAHCISPEPACLISETLPLRSLSPISYSDTWVSMPTESVC